MRTTSCLVVPERTVIHAGAIFALCRIAHRYPGTTVSLKSNGREAMLGRAISIAALNIRGGDTVTIHAEGAEGRAAVHAVTEVLTEAACADAPRNDAGSLLQERGIS